MSNAIISDPNSPQTKRILHIALALSTSTGAQWLWDGYPTFSNDAEMIVRYFRTILGYRKARKYRRDYVGYLFQDYTLIPDQTVYDNINLATRPNKILPTKAMLTQITQALDQVGLAGYERRQVCELSGGEQQRVAIARLLVRPPKVVLADEPTGALDYDNSLRVIAHLRDLADGGASVVVATHSDLVADSADQHIKVA